MLPTFLLLNRTINKRRNIRKSTRTAKNDKNQLDVDCCRTCLATEGLVDIFNNKECEKKRSHELRLVTGLEIKLNDGLSQKICYRCIETMQSALQFRQTSRKSQKSLLNMLCGKTKKFKSKPVSVSFKRKLKNETIEEDVKVYDDDMFAMADDFQNETDYLCNDNEDSAPIKLEQKARGVTPGRRKREVIPNALSYKCNTCNKEFRMKTTYKAHLRFHTNYCVCETCGKRCRNNNQLQEHKRARHGLGRIHKCAYCEYSSATKEALTIHERRHTGERPYICDHCGATFHRRSNLVQHIAIHLPDKNFQCDMCPKRLKSRKFLQIHKHNAHTGKRYGYLCSVCAHRFEKPNKCSICFKREKSRKLLQVHVYKSHRENQYRYLCPVCKESFARPSNVRRHLTRVHNVPRERQGQIERFEVNLRAPQFVNNSTNLKIKNISHR